LPGSQSGGPISQGPPQVGPPHCGVGVARGVGVTGTQSHVPAELIWHWPVFSSASSHGTFGGHDESVHGPLHAALSHCGVPVGLGVRVGGGETGTQLQLPAASATHWPRSASAGHA
jgi:hypothetical protein